MMSSHATSIAIALSFAIPLQATAKTLTAASCERAAVVAAIKDPSFANGDTVVVPPGNCTWTAAIESTGGQYGPPNDDTLYNRWFTLKGSGAVPNSMDRVQALAACAVPGQTSYTCIIDKVSRNPFPNVPVLMRWDTIRGGETRITGFTFIGGDYPGSGTGNDGIMQFRGNSNQFRFDHNAVFTHGTTGIHLKDFLLGVVDHNFFDITETGWAWYMMHHSWGNVGAYGDNSWATPSTIGTGDAMFFEDNYVINRTFNVATFYCQDGWSGYRAVHRYNTFINCSWANHGTESGGRERGARQDEIYENKFIWDLGAANSFAGLIGTRGGTGVIFNNVLELKSGQVSTAMITLETQRAHGTYPFFGACNNSNAWDLNTANPADRQCIDQLGAGPGTLLSGDTPTPVWTQQTHEPMYIWNNTTNGSVGAVFSRADVVTEGADYFLTEKPNYKPYVYPHPLVGGGATTKRPAAPTDLRVQSL